MQPTVVLPTLALATLSFAAIVVTLSVVTALLINGLLALGGRWILHRLLFLLWLSRRLHKNAFTTLLGMLQWRQLPSDTVRESESELALLLGAGHRGYYGLPYRQFCGQIATVLHQATSREAPQAPRTPLFQAFANITEIPTTRQLDLRFMYERGLDDLQQFLARATTRSLFVLTFVLTLYLLLAFRASGENLVAQGTPIGIYIGLAVVVTVVSPLVSVAIERLQEGT